MAHPSIRFGYVFKLTVLADGYLLENIRKNRSVKLSDDEWKALRVFLECDITQLNRSVRRPLSGRLTFTISEAGNATFVGIWPLKRGKPFYGSPEGLNIPLQVFSDEVFYLYEEVDTIKAQQAKVEQERKKRKVAETPASKEKKAKVIVVRCLFIA